VCSDRINLTSARIFKTTGLRFGPQRSLGSAFWRGFEPEPWNVLEDAVVGDKRDAQTQRCGGDPAVSVVLTLGESVADSLAVDPEWA
jgi:hypothetical protein